MYDICFGDNANVEPNRNLNTIILNPYTTLNQYPNDDPSFYSLSLEISLQEQLSPDQMSAHHWSISVPFLGHYMYTKVHTPEKIYQ